MKFFLLFISGISLPFTVLGQVQRLVLVEEFTQASCGPCAGINPPFNAMLNTNTNKIAVIKYQTNWPGIDPMNEQNPNDVSNRVSYYGVNLEPWGQVNGKHVNASTGGVLISLTQTRIDSAYAVPSPFTINVNHSFSANYDSIFIQCIITATQPFSTNGPLYTRIALVEKDITFNTPPGTNGEKKFENVMRKMYPDAGGTILPNTWALGQTQTILFAEPIPYYIYNNSEISIISFIQSDNDKQVHQVGYSIPQFAPAPIPHDISVQTINVPDYSCLPSVSPSVTIINYGTTAVTNLDLKHRLNNGIISTIPWTGFLPADSTTTISLPYQFITSGMYTISCNASMPNGKIDYDPGNDKKEKKFLVVDTITFSPNISEGFENSTFPPSNWHVFDSHYSPIANYTWDIYSVSGGFGNSPQCAFLNLQGSLNAGARHELYMKNIDLTNVSSSTLSFNLANAQLFSQTGYVPDTLQVKVSSDCGITWSTVYTKWGANLATNGGIILNTTIFNPSATTWRNEILNLNSFVGQKQVIIKFVAINGTGLGTGSQIYVDDINLTSISGIEKNNPQQVKVFPNPSSGQFNFTGLEKENKIGIYDVAGRLIYQILSQNESEIVDLASKEKGVYFYKISNDKKEVQQGKLLIQ